MFSFIDRQSNSASGYRLALLVGTILCSSTAVPVIAQTSGSVPLAPVESSPDNYGVDLATGALNLSLTDISVGAGDSGLVHKRHWVGNNFWRDEFDVTMSLTSSTKAVVSTGGKSIEFNKSGNKYFSSQGDGSTLVPVSGNYVYTSTDGIVITFVPGGSGSYQASQIKSADGETLTFSYATAPFYMMGFGGSPYFFSRVTAVESNAGYKTTYEYVSDQAGYPEALRAWMLRKRISVVNTKRPEAGVVGATTYDYTAISGAGTTTITDFAGRATKYGIDGQGRIVSMALPGSASPDISLAYNSAGRVTSVTDATGATSYGYADTGNLRTTRVTSPNGGVTVYVFNISTLKLQSATNEVGNTTSLQYDAAGRTTRVTEAEGNAVQYAYDARGNVVETRAVAKPGSGTADAVSSAEYICIAATICDKPSWTQDARGSRTYYGYDPTTGATTNVTSAPTSTSAQSVTQYGYATVNGIQRLARSTRCRISSVCAGSSAEQVTEYTYDANGLPVTLTEKAGDGSVAATTAIAYDAVGNKVSVDGPLPGADDTTYIRYDPARQIVGQVSADPDGAGPMARRATRTTYDARGRAVLAEQGTVPDASAGGWAAFSPLQQIARTYDGADRQLSETASAGGTIYSVTQNSYIGQRLDCSSVRMNAAAWNSLPASACTAQADGASGPDRIAKFTYDLAGRVTQATAGYGTAQAATEVSAYTANGEISSRRDANGNVTTYGYDGMDRSSSTTFPGGSYESLTYDPNGNVTQRRLRDGNTLAYSYDVLNQLIGVTVPSLVANDRSRTYSYDLAGNLTRATEAGGRTVDLAYDALGRQTGETSNYSTRSFAYDALGRRTRLTWQDGFFVTYDYLVTGEMSAIRENGGFVLASFAYDNLGRRTSTFRGNGTTTSYGFNSGSQLTGLTHDLAGAGNDVTTTFGYNTAGQIASRSMSNGTYSWTGGVNVDRGYTVNGLNQYTQAGSVGFAYDGRGNLTNSGGSLYQYTAENRLASGPGGYLGYDPLGRLDDESGRLILQYDGDQLITEQSPGGAIARRYVFGPGGDEPIVWYEGAGAGDRRWLVADERGSIIAATDGAGNAIAIDRYDEFGIPASTNLGRFQYTGQTWLSDFGMYHYKARVYSPTLGRFMQADPIGYADGMNMYDYVGGDPINKADPSGLAGGCPPSTNGDIVVCGTRPAQGSGGTKVNIIKTIVNAAKLANQGLCAIGIRIFGGCKKKSKPKVQDAPQAALQQAAYTPDRCSSKTTPLLNGRAPFFVSNAQLQSIAQAKFLQHSFAIGPSGRTQSTFGGAMTSGSRVASGAAFLIGSRNAVAAGGLNSRITGNLGVSVGRDAYSIAPSTSYMTVIVGPPLGVANGLPERPVVSIYPGC